MPRTVESAACACGKTFTPERREQVYCGRRCANRGRRRWNLDNPLKQRFATELERREPLLIREAAAEMGLYQGIISAWLAEKGRALSSKALARVAAWLGITTEAAARMQGGTAEDQQRSRLETVITASDKFARYRQRLRSDPRFAREATRAARTALATKLRSDPAFQVDFSQRIRAGQEAYFDDPTWQPSTLRTAIQKTVRWKARQILSGLRGAHPGLSEAKLRTEAIARLRRPPYSFSRSYAEALLEERPRSPGRPGNEERCAALQELMQEEGWNGFKSAPRGFDTRLGDRIDQDYKRAQMWREYHQPRCWLCSGTPTAVDP
jgi:hypothetical protein